MWYYLIIALATGSIYQESNHDVFPTKEICEKVATDWAISAHSTTGEEYGYKCKLDPHPPKEYHPKNLGE